MTNQIKYRRSIPTPKIIEKYTPEIIKSKFPILTNLQIQLLIENDFTNTEIDKLCNTENITILNLRLDATILAKKEIKQLLEKGTFNG